MHPLESLRRQHHALLPPYLLQLPPAHVLAEESSQQWIIHHILNDPDLKSYQPEKGYSRAFWRRIVAELEKGVEHIREESPDSVSDINFLGY